MHTVASCHSVIAITEPGKWHDAVADVPHAFAHTWASCRAMQLSSGLPTFLYRYDDGARRIVCPFSTREFDGARDLLTPFGFSGFSGHGDAGDFARHWSEYAREQEFVCGYIGLHPALDGARFAETADVYEANSAFLLDLTGSEAALLGRMSLNRRRQIRAWDNGHVELVEDRDALSSFFHRRLATFLDERGAAKVNYQSRASLELLASLDNVLMLGAAVEGTLQAVSMFGYTRHVGEFLFNVSLPEGQRHSAPLIWCAAMRLRSLDVPTLNLGGGIRPGDGVAAFKTRFGGREVPLRSVRQVYRPDRFDALCRSAGVTTARDRYFPPYHAV